MSDWIKNPDRGCDSPLSSFTFSRLLGHKKYCARSFPSLCRTNEFAEGSSETIFLNCAFEVRCLPAKKSRWFVITKSPPSISFSSSRDDDVERETPVCIETPLATRKLGPPYV